MPEPFAVIVKEPAPSHVVVDEIEGAALVINIGAKGEAGEKGEKGEAGSGGDLHYVFTQSEASEIWEIKHDLGKFPSVTVQDSTEDMCEGSCEYVNENEIRLLFSAAFSGKAYLN